MRLGDAFATFRGHRTPNVQIVGRRRVWFALSGALILLSVGGLVLRGLNFSISFTGGALLQFTNVSGAPVSEYRRVMAEFGRGDAQVEILGGDEVSIRTESLVEPAAPAPTPTPTAPAPTATDASPSPGATASPEPSPSPEATPSPAETASPASPPATPEPSPTPRAAPARSDQLRAALARTAGIDVDDINETDVGPTWGSTISRKMFTGFVVFLVAVFVYMALRFEWKMSVAGIVALVHDLAITGGVYSLVGREVSPETVIAILTISGYSLYDTVVIFDKIKENSESAALVARDTYSGVVNLSMNQVLMRSVNTSISTLLPLGALLLFGGDTLKDFAFALFVGVAIGSYSSVFLAAPLVAFLKEREPRYRQIRARAEARAAVRPGLRVVEEPRPAEAEPRELEPATSRAAPRPSAPPRAPASPRPAAARKKKGRSAAKPRRRRR